MKITKVRAAIVKDRPSYRIAPGVYRLTQDDRLVIIDPLTFEAVAIQLHEFPKKKEN